MWEPPCPAELLTGIPCTALVQLLCFAAVGLATAAKATLLGVTSQQDCQPWGWEGQR